MTTPRPMTAAEYKAHAEQTRASEEFPTEIYTCKSGSVWELRRPNLKRYVMSGRLPHGFLLRGRAAWKGKVDVDQIAKEMIHQMSDKEFLSSVEFMANLLSDITVNPHIAYPAEKENDIDPLDVLEEDQEELIAWLNNHLGVPGLSGLESFRGGRKRTARHRAHRKTVQPATVSDAAN